MNLNTETYGQLIATLPDIVYRIDINGNFTYLNESVEKLGYTTEQLLGEHFSTILHPEDVPRVSRSIVLPKYRGQATGSEKAPLLFDERRTGDRITKKLSVRLKKRDDIRRSFDEGEVIAIGLYDTDKERKNFIGTIGVIRDVSDVKRATRAVLLAEKHYRLLIENSSEIISVIAHDGTILYESESIQRILGYDSIEITGENMIAFIHPEDRGPLREILNGNGKSIPHASKIQYRQKHRDGTWRFLNSSVKKIKGRDEKTMCFIMNSHDITERRYAEEKLLSSEYLFRSLTEATTAITFIIQDDIIRYINSAIEELLGYEQDWVIGMHFQDLIHPTSHDQIRDIMARQRDESMPHQCELRIISQKDAERWFEITALPIEFEGKPALLGTGFDITNRILSEERLKASLREKEILLKELHHRVKNNMQIITSLLSLQLRYIKDEKDREIFSDSQNRIHSIALVHEKLYQSEDLSCIDFTEYLQLLIKQLINSYGVNPEKIEIAINAFGITLGIDRAIPCALIINEIVSNSLKHAFPSEREGIIRIALNRNEKGEYTLILSDNGIGLPETLEFENTETLGLQLVRTLVQQLKGSIRLNRTGGTEYTINF